MDKWISIRAEDLEKERRLTVGLARDVDYKNGQLFEMGCEMKKQDALLNEVLEERQSLKQELEKLKNMMESQRKEFEQQAKELDDLQALVRTQSSKQENQETKKTVESQRAEITLTVGEKEEEGELMQLKGKLKDLENENADLETKCRALIVKECNTNAELHDARKEAKRVLQGILNSRTTLAIKIMGQVDSKPFQVLCAEKCFGEDWQEESAKLCSSWQERMKDPNWHPFKIEEKNGVLIRIIDEDDEMLKEARNEGGEDVYKAVVNALWEMEEYNASGRYPVAEIWYSKQGRKASLKEIIEYLGKQLQNLKSKRKRLCITCE